MIVKITDKFQNYIDNNFPNIRKYNFIYELMFYGIFIYYYYFGPIQDTVHTFALLKYIILIIVLRYIFNSITTIKIQTKNDKDKNYFQLNSKLAIFILFIIFLSKNRNPYEFSTIIIIINVILFSSALNLEQNTIDNISTTILVLYLYSLQLIK